MIARGLAARDKYQFQWWATDRLGAQPVSGKKKGADKGIDGVIPFFAGPKEDYKRALVSVKGGEHVTVGMVRDLRGVLEREGEPLGILLTLAPPTREMRREAAAAGHVGSRILGLVSDLGGSAELLSRPCKARGDGCHHAATA